MTKKIPKRALQTTQQLRTVALNLKRHAVSGVYYGFKKMAGKVHSQALGTADRQSANAKLSEWLAELSSVNPATRDMTLAMLIAIFKAGRTSLSVSTITGDEGRIAQFKALFPRPMETLVSLVRPSDISTWLALIAPGKRNSTYNQYRAFVRHLFAIAKADGVIAHSPFDDKEIKKARRQEVQRRIPSTKEFAALISEIRKPSWKAKPGQHGGYRGHTHQPESADFAEFLGLAGVGQGEATKLKWEDIDDVRNSIHYTRRKTQKGFDTPIYGWLRPLLERLRAEAGSNPTGPVFKIKDVGNALDGASKRLGLPHFTQRSLRAMRIKLMWEAGVDVKVIALMQGHRDGGKLIMTIYTEVFGSSSESYERAQIAKAEAAEKG